MLTTASHPSLMSNINTDIYGKGKVLPYSLPSVGPGADPTVQAVSLQVTFSIISLAAGCHYFPPGRASLPRKRSPDGTTTD